MSMAIKIPYAQKPVPVRDTHIKVLQNMDTAILDTDMSWSKNPFGGFTIGAPFADVKAQLDYEAEEDLKDTNVDATTKEGVHEYIRTVVEEYATVGNVYPGTTDTSIGGNDALNPLWQFGLDDDIIWPQHRVDIDRGLGRVYAETYQDTQHILWLSFGVPKFCKLTEFYKNAGDRNLAAIMTKDGASLSYKIGAILGAGIKLAVKLPWYPLIWIFSSVAEGIEMATKDVKVNKYYEFIPKMDLYYKAVITILSHLTVGMNLTPNGDVNPATKEIDDSMPMPGEDISPDLIKRMQNVAPNVLRQGPDILYILGQRARWENKSVEHEAGAAIFARAAEGKYNTWDFLRDAIFKKFAYVGFRIERGTDMSESLSNSTGEAEIAGKLNGMSNTARETQFSIGNGEGLGKALSGVKNLVDGIAAGVGNIVGLGDAISMVTQGNGYFDIPEVWKNSSMSKNFSFDISLRARYGDPLTIYQSIYIPLAMLIAGAFPVGLGKNSYTSPFLCQAYSRGLFSIPTGIIDSITIKRGLPEHGWSYEHLPTAVDVSISIKDLSPAMYLGLHDGNVIDVALEGSILDTGRGGNTVMQMYLGTLAGLDIFKLTNPVDMYNRRLAALMKINKATWGNPKYWSLKVSQIKPVRAVSNIMRSDFWGTKAGKALRKE